MNPQTRDPKSAGRRAGRSAPARALMATVVVALTFSIMSETSAMAADFRATCQLNVTVAAWDTDYAASSGDYYPGIRYYLGRQAGDFESGWGGAFLPEEDRLRCDITGDSSGEVTFPVATSGRWLVGETMCPGGVTAAGALSLGSAIRNTTSIASETLRGSIQTNVETYWAASLDPYSVLAQDKPPSGFYIVQSVAELDNNQKPYTGWDDDYRWNWLEGYWRDDYDRAGTAVADAPADPNRADPYNPYRHKTECAREFTIRAVFETGADA